MTIQEVYPVHADRERYDKALKQYVIAENWLFNQSELDLWFNIDGFEIKVPSGKRLLNQLNCIMQIHCVYRP